MVSYSPSVLRFNRLQFPQTCDKKPYQLLAISVNGLVGVVVGNEINITKKLKPIEGFTRLLKRNRLLGYKVILRLRLLCFGQIRAD